MCYKFFFFHFPVKVFHIACRSVVVVVAVYHFNKKIQIIVDFYLLCRVVVVCYSCCHCTVQLLLLLQFLLSLLCLQVSSQLPSGTNNGALTISDACTGNEDILAGGIVANAKVAINNCTNTGAITNAGAVTKKGQYIDIGGIAGYNNGNSPLTNCSNSDKI